MRSILSAFLLLFLLSTLLQKICLAHPDNIVNKSFAERYHYVDSLRLYMIYHIENVEAGSKKLNEWISQAEKENDDALAYQLKFSSIYLKNHANPLAEEQNVLQHIKSALKEGYSLEAADGYYILSGWINNMDRKAKAMEYALLGYSLCKDYTIQQYPPKVKTLYRLAEWYYFYKEFRKTVDILQSLWKTEGVSAYNILTGGELNTLALAYREMQQYDSAIYYFKQIYEDKLHKIPLAVRGIAAGNIGTIYKRQGNLPDALTWMKREIELWRHEAGKTNSLSCFQAYIGIANIYYDMGNEADGRKYSDSAHKMRLYHYDIYVLSSYYKLYARIHKADGNYAKALLYTDSLLIAKDSLDKKANLSQLLTAEKRVEASKHQLEIAELNNIRQKSIWIRNFAISLVIFAAVVLILLINRSRLKHKQRELVLEHEKTKAEATLAGYTLKMQEKNLQLIQLQEELTELNSEQDIVAKNELIRQLQQSTILTDEQWEDFRNVFEQVHIGFIQRIRERYPDITPAELHYIVLVKLNMTNKEIANVLGISANSVRNYKFRLRKKFGLTENEDIEAVVHSI